MTACEACMMKIARPSGTGNTVNTVVTFSDEELGHKTIWRFFASLRRVNPTLNIYPNATSSFLKPSYLADDGDLFAIREMPNDERSRACESSRLCFEINPTLHVTTTAMKKLCSLHGLL